MNRSVFFDEIRASIFGGKLSASQVGGIERIIDYRDAKYPDMPDDELAYVLATVKWETASTMQPVTEYGSQKYLRSKKYWPWIGRGLVQITWKANYAKFGIMQPEKALEWETALHICFVGMVYGKFTGKKLSDYINDEKCDYIGARRIINGTDKARQIAVLADKFRAALIAAVNAHPEIAPEPVEPDPPQLPKPATQSTTIWATILQWLAGGGLGGLAWIGKIDWKLAAVLAAFVLAAGGFWIIRERLLKRREKAI